MPYTRPPHPHTYNGDLANPPAALSPLCLMPHWVAWRWQYGGRGWTKPPFRATDPDRHAANNDPTPGVRALMPSPLCQAGKASGIGFVLTNTKIAAVDLDKCRDPETGYVDAWAQAILDAAPNTYQEVTVSGSGLRIIGTATGPEAHRRFSIDGREGAGVEVYRRAVRYVTISGLEIGHCTTLANIDRLIDDIVTRHNSTADKHQ